MVWWAGLTHGSSGVTGWWLSCMRRIDRLGSLSKCSPAGVNVLAGHGQGERVEVTESREIGRAEGSVEQVEALQMGSVRTSIPGNLDPHPGPLKTPVSTPQLRRPRKLDRREHSAVGLRALDASPFAGPSHLSACTPGRLKHHRAVTPTPDGPRTFDGPTRGSPVEAATSRRCPSQMFTANPSGRPRTLQTIDSSRRRCRRRSRAEWACDTGDHGRLAAMVRDPGLTRLR